VLPCALCCAGLRFGAPLCAVLRGAVLCCAVLCCACCAVLCCAVLCCAVLCCMCCAALCCAVLCCAVLCCAVLCCNPGFCLIVSKRVVSEFIGPVPLAFVDGWRLDNATLASGVVV
jgi:hypothetical protein